MEKLKKIEKRLTKLYRLQRKLEKKRKQLVKLAAKNGQAASVKKLIGRGKPAKAARKPLETFRGRFILSLVCALTATACTVAAFKLVKDRKAVDAADESLDDDLTQVSAAGKDYEQASLEELEAALLKVENQLDEVNAAIEKNKK